MPTTRRRAAASAASLDYIEESLRPFAVPIDSLTPDPENPRIHDQINMEAIEASLREFGQTIPIVVQKQGMIVRVGNGRVQAAKNLGWSHVAAVVTDKPEAVMKAFGIADNRTGELARWNQGELARLLDEIQDSVPDLLGSVGFEMREVETLIARYLPEVAGDSGLVSADPSGSPAQADPVFGSDAGDQEGQPQAGSLNANASAVIDMRYVNLSFPAEAHARFVELVRFFGSRYDTSITADVVLKTMTELKESLQE